jgi:tetratricopeptide (TPR) repeat protein
LIIAHFPDVSDAWVTLAIIQETRGHLVEAINLYMVAAYIETKNDLLWRQLASKASEIQLYKEAIECCNVLLDIHDQKPHMIVKKALMLWKIYCYGHSIVILENLIISTDHWYKLNSKLIEYLSRWYYFLRRHNEGIRLIENSLAMRSGFCTLNSIALLNDIFLNKALYEDGNFLVIYLASLKDKNLSEISKIIDLLVKMGLCCVRTGKIALSRHFLSSLWYIELATFGDLFVEVSQHFFDQRLYEQCLNYLCPVVSSLEYGKFTILYKIAVCQNRLGSQKHAQKFIDKTVDGCMSLVLSCTRSLLGVVCYYFSLGWKIRAHKVLTMLRQQVRQFSITRNYSRSNRLSKSINSKLLTFSRKIGRGKAKKTKTMIVCCQRFLEKKRRILIKVISNHYLNHAIEIKKETGEFNDNLRFLWPNVLPYQVPFQYAKVNTFDDNSDSYGSRRFIIFQVKSLRSLRAVAFQMKFISANYYFLQKKFRHAIKKFHISRKILLRNNKYYMKKLNTKRDIFFALKNHQLAFLLPKLDNVVYLCIATTYISWKESAKSTKKGLRWIGNYLDNSSCISGSVTLYNVGRFSQSIGLVRLALIYYRRAFQSYNNRYEFKKQQNDGITGNIFNQEAQPFLSSFWGKAQKGSCIRNLRNIFFESSKYALSEILQDKSGC